MALFMKFPEFGSTLSLGKKTLEIRPEYRMSEGGSASVDSMSIGGTSTNAKYVKRAKRQSLVATVD